MKTPAEVEALLKERPFLSIDDDPSHFVTEWISTAAALICEQSAEIARLKDEAQFLHKRRGELVIERDRMTDLLREASDRIPAWATGVNTDLIERISAALAPRKAAR